MEEYMESELSGIFQVKLVTKNIVLGSPGTQFMHMRVNKTIKKILSNFIPHQTIAFDDRDQPWINSQVKHLINEKNAMYKTYLKNNKSNQSVETFQSFQSQLS